MKRMRRFLKLGEEPLSLKKLKDFLNGEYTLTLSKEGRERVSRCREFVESKLREDKPHYGINTGFGILANTRIPGEKLDELQLNFIRSHSSGVGDPLPSDAVRLMMLLRANVLALGYSGVRALLVDLLVGMIESDVIPVVPSQGSVGASGDLAPSAHITLAMIGEGEVFYKGKMMAASEAMKLAGLKPIKLKAKEGLSSTNGTQMMASLASIALIKSFDLLMHAEVAGALSVEGLRGSLVPFDSRIHNLRAHPGQVRTAEIIRGLLDGSEIVASHRGCSRVQDPYSLRCIPQVHGAVRDAFTYAKGVVEREINSCTDNPLVFKDDGEILSGGNFHGEPLAIAMDLVAIVVTELGNISERRIEQMNNPKSGELPVKSLVPSPGLNSGFMLSHVVASALASENKVLSHPASVDTITTFGGQEDHVSMGAWAARKVLTVIDNVEKILAIEFLSAAQAIDLHEERLSPGKLTKKVYDLIRKNVTFMEKDRYIGLDIGKIIGILKSREILREVGYEELL